MCRNMCRMPGGSMKRWSPDAARTDDSADRLVGAHLVAHEPSVWSDDGHSSVDSPMAHKTMRAALRDHQRLLDAICDGNSA